MSPILGGAGCRAGGPAGWRWVGSSVQLSCVEHSLGFEPLKPLCHLGGQKSTGVHSAPGVILFYRRDDLAPLTSMENLMCFPICHKHKHL